MKKLDLFIIALFGLTASQLSWSMLTVNKIKPSRSLTQYHTQEKIQKDELCVQQESQIFLSSYGQHSPNKTGKMFCDLSIRAKKNALPCLSHNQKLLIWCGAQGLEVPFLSAVFNGNEKVALMYSQKPIGEILEAYASAKEMTKRYPLGVGKVFLKEQHYMMLKNSQRILLSDIIDQRGFIRHSDIPKFMKALKMLHNIDPQLFGGIEEITDLIQIYPSLNERGTIFYGMIPNDAFKDILLLSLKVDVVATPLGLLWPKIIFSVNFPPIGSICNIGIGLFSFLFTGFSMECLYRLHPQYQDHLKINILPNQPTLTDYLKKNNLS